MSQYLTGLATFLQVLFTTTAETLGKATGFIQRQRHLTASDFATTLVFRWMAKPKATVESIARELQMSPQALQERFTPAAQAFLRALLLQALQKALKSPADQVGLLQGFTAVILEDTTTITLPAELADAFPGCGGGSAAATGAAALKVLLRWDVHTGDVWELSVHAGRTSDKTLPATAQDVPEGALHVADQGFFDSARWAKFSARQYWISRVPAPTLVCWQGLWQPLSTLLGQLQSAVFEGSVQLVKHTQLACRLVAQRCPAEVANRRRQKLRTSMRRKKGREPSAAQLIACDWQVFATNTTAEQLGIKEVGIVYRCRWQVELFFKRAKQLAGWSYSRGHRGDRVLVELYAKLLGLLVLHWGTLLRGGPLHKISLWKRMEVVQDYAQRLQDSLSQGGKAVCAVLRKMVDQLNRIRPQPQSRKKPSTRQLLLNPQLSP